jgi:phosphohistidine phosphatase
VDRDPRPADFLLDAGAPISSPPSQLQAHGRGRSIRTTPTLYLLRHAKSSWDDPTLSDPERPLAARGRRDAKRIGKHLRRAEIRPELVLCSTSQRTRETLAAVEPSLAGADIEVDDRLYGATAADLLERLHEIPDNVSSVMLIGHNPALQDLALALAAPGGNRDRIETKLVTGALATLAVPRWRDLAPGEAELVAYVQPKELHQT